MKNPRTIFALGWMLLIVTGLSGLGFTHFFESAFSPRAHALIGALGQLLPLAGLFVLTFVFSKGDEASSNDRSAHQP